VCDEAGVVTAATFHPANRADCRAFSHTLSQSGPTVEAFCRGKEMYGDRAYDTSALRTTVARFGVENRIAQRQTQGVYSATRAKVERVFAWLDKCRRLLVRYDRYIVAYKAFTWISLTGFMS
jgi:transposase